MQFGGSRFTSSSKIGHVLENVRRRIRKLRRGSEEMRVEGEKTKKKPCPEH